MSDGFFDALWQSPEEKLALRGGLKGRLAGEFCLLQAQADALTRQLDQYAPDPVRSTALDILVEMKKSLAVVERLADHAATLALGRTAARYRRAPADRICDLIGYLQAFAACANEELAASHSKMRVELLKEVGSFWVAADEALLDDFLANLISNAAANGATRVLLHCTQQKHLVYEDDSRGPEDWAADLLRDGRVDQRIVEGGFVGLLIVRMAFESLGWGLIWPEQPQGGGLRLEFCPVVEELEKTTPPVILLEDDTIKLYIREQRLHRVLQRELVATLGQ